MKKLMTAAALIGAISAAKAQNTFPTSGNAGIGITIPAYKLDVGPSSPADGIRITQLSSGSSALHLSNISGTHGIYGNMWSFYSSGASDSWLGGLGNFAISNTPTGGSINTAPGTNSPNFFIQGSSGNVGVNTISPANKLEVAAAAAGDGIRISQPGTGATGLHFSPSTGHLWSFYSLGSSDGWGGAGCFAIQDVTGNSSLPRFFITAGGRVAIGGGYSPASQFEVSTSSVDDGAEVVQQTTYASCLKLSHSSAPQGMWSLKAFGSSNTEGAGNFGIYDNTAQATRLLVNSAGNVVVGTGNIIAGNDATLNKTVLGSAAGSGLGYGTGYLGLNASRNGSNWTFATDGSHNGGSVMFGDVYGNLYISAIASTGNSNQTLTDANVMNSSKLRIKSNGQVVIGLGTGKISQSHTGALLAVEGTAVCQEIFVTAPGDWADYVFDKNYKLMSIENLESYVKKNHHLPNVPAANEIKKEGVDLGQMSKLQMEKIEELTLYIIELKKELAIVQKKLKENQ